MKRLLVPLLAAPLLFAVLLGARLSATSGAADDTPVFQLPWPIDEAWRLTNYPHPSYGWDSPADGAIDFQPPGYIACQPFVATDRVVRPVAPGTVVFTQDYIIEVAHSGGYTSFYYHVANTRVAPGDKVELTTDLGNPSCHDRPGASVATTGVHVHFAMKQDGRFISLRGLKFAGWEVTESGLYKDGVLLTEYNIPFVENEAQPGVLVPTPTSTPDPEATPTPGTDPWAAIDAGWSLRKLPGYERSEWHAALPCVEVIYQWEDGEWLRGLPDQAFGSALEETRAGPFYWVLAGQPCMIGEEMPASSATAAAGQADPSAVDETYDGPEGPPAGP